MKGHQQGVECVAFVPGRDLESLLYYQFEVQHNARFSHVYMIFIMIWDKSSAPTKFPTPQEPPAPPS